MALITLLNLNYYVNYEFKIVRILTFNRVGRPFLHILLTDSMISFHFNLKQVSLIIPTPLVTLEAGFLNLCDKRSATYAQPAHAIASGKVSLYSEKLLNLEISFQASSKFRQIGSPLLIYLTNGSLHNFQVIFE